MRPRKGRRDYSHSQRANVFICRAARLHRYSVPHTSAIADSMLWIKAFHIILMVTWFAGLFYLPRLFVYHAQAADRIGQDRFKVMERKLLIIMTIGAVGTVVTGLWLVVGWWAGALQGSGWLHAKLMLVAGLIAYHLWLWRLVGVFARDANTRSDRFYRLINEVPAVALIGIVILVVVKPF